MDKPVVLVTGASRGIGRAAAVALAAAAGYRVALVARGAGELAEAGRATKLAGGDRAEIVADVSRPEECERAVGACVAKFGRLDAVVHAAGVAPVASIEQTTVEQWRAAVDTNLSAAFYLMKYAWGELAREKPEVGSQKSDVSNGCVVLISSLAARDPLAGFGAYGAAKAGVNLLGLVGAREGQAAGVRVHTIGPGAVETGMFRAIATEAQWPREKTLAPEAVAGTIVDCVTGRLAATAGEVIWVHRTV
ncbi:MAG TPA: SDR family oxidoreductase [Tepidisphaeraceae bacterium]|nr:SDR family oxidoreductase [Tepidisphaeraceae bacterium]